MANKFKIPEDVLAKIRGRDKTCVYCHKQMKYPYNSKAPSNSATLEHLNEKQPFYWDDGLKENGIAICCGSCNSSRGKKKLRDWFKTSYCEDRKINEKTVAKPVKDYIKRKESR